jgi:hypothetical protein
VERRTAGPLTALLTLLAVAAGVLGLTSLATLGGGAAPRTAYAAPAAGTLIKRTGSAEVSVFVGGARIVYRSQADLNAGYGPAPTVVTVPDAYYEALPTQVAPGTLIKAAGNPAIAVVRDGRRRVFPTWDSLVAAYGPKPPFVVVPAYYFDRLPDAGP